MKKLLLLLLICALVVTGLSPLSSAQQNNASREPTGQPQASTGSASSSSSSGGSQAALLPAKTNQQSQHPQQAADANRAESGKEMNAAKLPKTSPTALRVEEDGDDEPLSDIDPETLRELKRRSSVPQGQNLESASSTNYSAKEDEATASSTTRNPSKNIAPAPLAPTLLQNFAGVSDSDQSSLSTPPDTNMAAGPNHVMVVDNSLLAIYSKTGTLITKSSLSSWFNNVCPGCGVFDPRITYDPGAGRWIMMGLYRDATSQSRLLLSISQTSDPTSSWWNYSLDAVLNYSGENTWADYPDVGFDGIPSASGGAVYVTVNQFTFSGPSFRTAVLYILPKSGLYTGTSISYWRAWDRRNNDNTQGFTYRASKTYGNPGGEFLINTENNGSTVSVWRVNPTYPPTTVDWTLQSSVNISSYFIAPYATQPGAADVIDTLDNRMYNAVWQNNRIYAAFTEAHNWGSGTVAALRYLKINTSSNTLEINETFGADGLHYYSPAIATDSSDNIVLVFSRSNASEFAGARYTGRLTTDASAQGSASLKAGTATLFQRSGTNSSRWGDYQAAAVDPSDGSKVWIYGEWAVDLAGISNDFDWGTWIGQVQFPGTTAPPSAPAANAATSVAGSSFTANWSSSSGATGYRLDVSTNSSFSSYVSGYQDLDVGSVLSRSVSGLSANTTYYYRVRAYNGGGTSGNSNTISVTTTAAGSGLIINATFDSSITNNANSAAIQAMINQAIGIYQAMYADPVTVSILFRYSTTGPNGSPLGAGTLAQSNYVIYTGISWNTYINALRADAKTTNDTAANASLPASALTTNIIASSANGRTVGLNTPPAMFANGSVGSGGPYDGIVTLNSAQLFQFTRPPGSNNYDALRSTEHEIDEVFGLGSYVNAYSDLRPQDLYSWSAPGTRNLTSAGSRYFSINSGNTNIVGFNQTSGGDFGDWLSGSCPQTNPYVQNAFSCAGQFSDVTATSPEGINLDVIGYDLTNPAATLRIDNVAPKAGRTTGGQQINLTGAFAGLSTVTIGGVSVSWSYTNGTSAIAFTSPAHAVGAVDIVLTPTSGNSLTKTNAFAYLPTIFTDDTLVAGVTTAKVQHITELRQAVDALCAVAGVSHAPWTDTMLLPFGTSIKAVHITELRTNLEAAAAQLGYTAASYTDSTLGSGFPVKRVHIEELRQRIRTIAG